MKKTLLLSALLLLPVSASASISVRSSKPKTIDVVVVNEPLSAAVAAIEPHLGYDVDLTLSRDPRVTWRGRQVRPEVALQALAKAASVQLIRINDRAWIRDAGEKTVTLDVKDADIREILTSIQKQCGIRNLMIDPEVQGKGTFLFTDLGCGTALKTVLQTMGLQGQIEANSVMTVGVQR